MAEISTEPVLVLGATGTIGRRVAGALADAGANVAPASRSGEVRFDWHDPTSWDIAIDGSASMFVMAPDGVAVDPDFIARAAERGVERLVLLSSRAIDVMNDTRLLAAEQAVRESGVEWTIVRADWFDQNFNEGFLADAVAAGQVVVPLGDMAQGFVDADDIAAVTAAALTNDGHAGQTLEVTGPEALTFQEAVDVVAEAIGHPISYDGSDEAYRAMMIGFGLDPQQVDADIASFAALREAGSSGLTDVVSSVAGRDPLPFADYAARAWPQSGA